MTQTNLSPQTKEIISRLYSSNEYNKREAIYRILFDRRTDLVPELKKAVKYEKNETIAVFMVQVCMTLTNFPRDAAMERRILEILQYEEGGKVNDITPTMWEYLENCATSQMIIAILAFMGNSIPANSFDFIEMCLTHPDPEVRAMVCEKAIKSGRPSHFAYVLNLVADKDPIVSQTAFLAIKNLPEQELSIILDYALGSPDEWVLKTVAPFLPNLITNNLRSVIAKVQYHSNQLVAHKAREALKVLDAIPYITKRSMKDHDEAEKRKEEEKEKEKKEEFVIENGKKVSLKEQLEQKRKEQEAKDKAIREANEALDKELAEIDPKEMEAFSKSMDNYDSVLPQDENLSLEEENVLPEEKTFVENTDFSLEADALSVIDDSIAEKAVSDIVTEADRKKQEEDEDEKAFLEAMASVRKKDEEAKLAAEAEQKALEASAEPEPAKTVLEQTTSENSAERVLNENSGQEEMTLNLESSAESSVAINEANADAGWVTEISNEVVPPTQTIAEQKEPVSDANELDLNIENSAQFLDADGLDLGIGDSESKTETVDLSGEDFNLDGALSELEGINVDNLDLTAIDLNSESNQTKQQKTEIKPQKVEPKAEKPVVKAPPAPQPKAPVATKPATTKVSVPASAKEIFEKYPSFLVDPLLEVFKATKNEAKLKAIDKVLNNLTAFLNICFLQSSMYYAQESDMLAKSIKDCIKGNLIGPSAIRCLHNFVLAMKAARGNNVFFTFPLARIMSSSIDTNPLMLMRELKEFLKEPEEPLDESVPQAVEGLLEILRGVKPITNNTMVMRAPKGARLPYADLSGPSAKPLAQDKLTSMDLPVGEVILISTDGAEAFGLFPFFKYSNKKVVFSIPNQEELSTFYERLEIVP